MKSVGIICEYNPFHNGHIYHIKKVKEMYPDYLIILVMSGNYTQRGEVSLIDKWDKTRIALNYVDLVVELPFPFSTQSADLFAYGSTQILKLLKANSFVFGSESPYSDLLKMAQIQKTIQFQKLVKESLNKGINYPTALSNATFKLTNIKTDKPNDLLGISYIKNLIDSDIEIKTIKRTNDFHNSNLNSNIISASTIRNLLINKKDISQYAPKETLTKMQNLHFTEDYFPYLKYKIISEINNLNIYQTVDEGLENRIKKYIYEANSLNDLITKIKTKRYTYNKLQRMFIHILCSFTKEDAKQMKEIEYIRVLGFNEKGQKYLKEIKEQINIPIITNYYHNKMFDFEIKVDMLYHLNEKDKENEYARIPIH